MGGLRTYRSFVSATAEPAGALRARYFRAHGQSAMVTSAVISPEIGFDGLLKASQVALTPRISPCGV
jgi:hypothetical protein